jgi:hypothetical protein
MDEMQVEDAAAYYELVQTIPPKLRADIDNYVDFGIRTKGVDLLMSNDLFGFTMWLELYLTPDLMYALYMYVQDVPSECFGSMDKVVGWKGCVGKTLKCQDLA